MISEISKLKDFKKVVSNKKYKKIFLITGKKSFYASKANIFLKLPKYKNIRYFFKKSYLPQFDELKIILKEIKD